MLKLFRINLEKPRMFQSSTMSVGGKEQTKPNNSAEISVNAIVRFSKRHCFGRVKILGHVENCGHVGNVKITLRLFPLSEDTIEIQIWIFVKMYVEEVALRLFMNVPS